MKKIFIIFLIFFFVNTNLQSELLDYFKNTRINYDFYGTVWQNSNFYVFGSAGIILEFNSDFELQNKIILDDKYNVQNVISDNYTFFGIYHKEFVFKSENVFKSLSLQKITDGNLYKIEISGEKLICLSDTEFIILDKELNVIKRINIPKFDFRKEFAIYNGNLVFISDSSHIDFIGLDNDNHTSLDLEEIPNIINSSPDQLIVINDTLFFQVGTDIYYYLNDNVSLYSSTIAKGLLCNIDNELYQFFNLRFTYKNLDSIYFYKILPDKIKRINISYNDRYISNLRFNNINYLSNILIAIGRNNLIYISKDKGVNWKLISHLDLQNYGKFKRFSKEKAVYVGPGLKFSIPYKYDILWKSQKNYDEYFVSENRFMSYVYNNGFVIGSYHDNDFFAYYDTRIQQDTNLVFTMNNGDAVKLKNVNNLIGLSFHDYKKYIFHTHNVDFLSYPTIFEGDYNNYLFTYDDNLNFQKISILDSVWVINVIDYENKLLAIADDFSYYNSNNPVSYLSFFRSVDSGESWEKVESLDILKDYNSIFTNSIVDNYLFLLLQRINEEQKEIEYDLVVVDLYDYSVHNVLTIGPDAYPLMTGMLKIKDVYFFNVTYLGDGEIIYRTYMNVGNILDSLDWVEDTAERYDIKYIEYYRDSLYLFMANDKLLDEQVIFFSEPGKEISVEDYLIEKIANVYLSDPFPNPANSKINFKIYYRKNSNLDNMKIKVYDIFGNLMDDQLDFEVNHYNNYSSQITCYCEDFPSGIYFFSVQFNGETCVKAAIVFK